eukprot:TRINITY_DN4338_c0_g1_i1.p1 TRINITY_DN4338_c0_g1~~TRINITY_DN4338_c0_g1_i1.p1  ORF type:complete len:270 (+),score=22.41 TRINITY_DN4338_c0_g1_i1:61-870(+)
MRPLYLFGLVFVTALLLVLLVARPPTVIVIDISPDEEGVPGPVAATENLAVQSNFEPGECTDYTIHPRFVATVCWKENGCTGTITVRNLKCQLPFPIEVAQGGLHGLVHALGPDAFRVRLESAFEASMVDLTHTGDCVYRGLANATLPGKVEVQAFTMFEGFHGHADPPFARPAYTVQAITPPKLRLNCLKPADPLPQSPSALPVCKSLVETGRWVRFPGDTTTSPPNLPLGDWPALYQTKNNVRFARSWGAHMSWQPYGCSYPETSNV